MRKNTKIYFIVAVIVILIIILGIVLYGKWFSNERSLENNNTTDTALENNLQEPMHVQLSEPNGEEKVKNIPLEMKEAGSVAGQENISITP